MAIAARSSSAPEGGAVPSDDGKLTLDIPPGALDEEVEITVTAVSVDELPEALREASGPGPAYRLQPDGLMFNEPVQVTLEFDRSELNDVSEDGVVAQLLLTQDADGEIESLDELVTEATLGEETVTVSGELSHFSFITKSDGALKVSLERVDSMQLVDVLFDALVVFRNVSPATAGFGFDIEPVFVNHFGVPAVNTVGGLVKPGTVTVGGLSGRLVVGYVCSAPGAGQYGIDTTWRVVRSAPSSELFRSYSVTIRGKVDCVTTLATPTPTDTLEPGAPTFTPAPTRTPEPEVTPKPRSKDTPVPTSTPVPTMTPVSTGTPVPTNTPEFDAAAGITTVRVGPNADATMTDVFVGLGGSPPQSMTHYRFRVMVTLGEQVGLIDFQAGVDHSVPPAGGSYAIVGEGVSLRFDKPVPTGGVKVLVETLHREFADSPLGSDTVTLTLQ